MKKLLLGLGTLTAVAVPTVAVVSCSLGSVFKSKINSLGEAKKDLGIIFNELKDKGTLDNKVDKFTSELTAKNVLHFGTGVTKSSVTGMTFDLTNIKLNQGHRVTGYGDWLGTHNDFYSEIPVTLNDAARTKATAYVLFKYDKTNGVFAQGRKGWLVNAAIGAVNLSTKLKHVISDITITTKDRFYSPFTDWN